MSKKAKLFMAMKYALITFICAGLLTGCAVSYAPVNGAVYSKVRGPLTATEYTKYPRSGTADAYSIMGIVAYGDASIDAAMKDGGIIKVHHIDYESMNILGFYARFTTIVYGE